MILRTLLKDLCSFSSNSLANYLSMIAFTKVARLRLYSISPCFSMAQVLTIPVSKEHSFSLTWCGTFQQTLTTPNVQAFLDCASFAQSSLTSGLFGATTDGSTITISHSERLDSTYYPSTLALSLLESSLS